MDKKHEDYMLYALLNGGIPYVVRNAPYDNVDGNFGSDGLSIEDRIKRANVVLDFYQKIKNEEMVEHRIINDHVQQTTFSNNISVEIDTKENTYRIV